MPRKTLLELVNHYLTKTNGFRVQSIYDSEESESAAMIAEEVFYHIVEKAPDIQFTESLINLEALADTNAPNYLRLPMSVMRIKDSLIRYNHVDSSAGVTSNLMTVEYLDPQAFLEWVSKNKNTVSNTQEVTDPSTGVSYRIINNKHPEYFTSFDGKYLAFDSYNSDEEATLQSTNSLVIVSSQPVFVLEDGFYPPLPDHLFSMYQDGVVAECAESLRQEAMPEVRRRYRVEMAKLQRSNKRVGYSRPLPRSYARNR